VLIPVQTFALHFVLRKPPRSPRERFFPPFPFRKDSSAPVFLMIGCFSLIFFLRACLAPLGPSRLPQGRLPSFPSHALPFKIHKRIPSLLTNFQTVPFSFLPSVVCCPPLLSSEISVAGGPRVYCPALVVKFFPLIPFPSPSRNCLRVVLQAGPLRLPLAVPFLPNPPFPFCGSARISCLSAIFIFFFGVWKPLCETFLFVKHGSAHKAGATPKKCSLPLETPSCV